MRKQGRLAVAVGIAWIGAGAVEVDSQPRHGAGRVNGTVALDVYASGLTIDVLTTVSEDGEKRLEHQRSLDGGAHWGPVREVELGEHRIAVASRGNDPQVVAHGDHIVAHWSTNGPERFGSGPLVTSVSHDGGATWTPGPRPAGAHSRRGQNFADMTADADGTFYVAWIGSHDGPAGRGLGMATSTDFGESWTSSQLADASACACCWNRMTAPRPGLVRVLYRDHGIRDMALATSTDHGKRWTLTGPVGDFGWAFDGCPHVGGGITQTGTGVAERLHAVVWTGHEVKHGLYLVRSDDGGVTWSGPEALGGEHARHADIGSSGTRVVASWDERGVIYATTSLDRGETWGAPQRLSDDGVRASHPIVTLVSDELVAFWTERAEDHRLTWTSRPVRVGADAPATLDDAGQ